MPDRALGNPGLIPHEGPDLILVDGFELEVRKGGKAGAQPFRNAEVALRPPETDIVVDVVDVGEHRDVARDEVRPISRQANGGEIRASADTKYAAPILLPVSSKKNGAELPPSFT